MPASTEGPLEEMLLQLLNQDVVSREEVKSLIQTLLNATRDDMYYNLSFQGRILPSNRTRYSDGY